ncbi:DEAD-box ATP-dependent RNA helicase 53-like [Olea europaea subsp. europaea]|uniref:DEAD-box ATP-dependent RNA helicase 53-like n=1 Tax=Olea europaea subsp. europaea TaxID=158383 RepID=A0A8S0TYM6_OLEEU|nr:DEAD-box ATP-dependent RNA helicase 53-like [Olea europaea subsp. europaea]
MVEVVVNEEGELRISENWPTIEERKSEVEITVAELNNVLHPMCIESSIPQTNIITVSKLFPGVVLEPTMQGRNMICRVRTGTGKTLAFDIPILDKIIRFIEKHGRGRNPLAVILTPTRELARQVEKEFYESALNLNTLCIYGGMPISHQMDALKQGVDVVVCTPGRVIDLIKRGSLNLLEV